MSTSKQGQKYNNTQHPLSPQMHEARTTQMTTTTKDQKHATPLNFQL